MCSFMNWGLRLADNIPTTSWGSRVPSRVITHALRIKLFKSKPFFQEREFLMPSSWLAEIIDRLAQCLPERAVRAARVPVLQMVSAVGVSNAGRPEATLERGYGAPENVSFPFSQARLWPQALKPTKFAS